MADDELPDITHARWRHKRLGYEVHIVDTRNYGCPVVVHRTVTVDRTQFGNKQRTWAVKRFFTEFEPIGKPSKARDLWDHL